MTRKGRPTDTEETRNLEIVRDVLAAGPQTWKELWGQVHERGIGSKSTLSSCLDKLEDLGDAVYDEQEAKYCPFFLGTIPGEISNEAWMRFLIRHRYHDTIFPSSNIAKAVASRTCMGSQKKFQVWTEETFTTLYLRYKRLLERLININDRTAAIELVELFVKANIYPSLAWHAGIIWNHRGKVRLQMLPNAGLTFKRADLMSEKRR
jgi:hypothetical protein